MKKTLSIHLGRQLFIIEEDAYDRLQQYLQRLENSLKGEKGVGEIIEDIEMRFAELLIGYLGETRKVVTIEDVEKCISSLGEPEEITDESPQQEEPAGRSYDNYTQGNRRLFRDTENGMLGGVAAGLAAYLNVDPVIVRLILVILFFLGMGFFIYIILWIVIPNAKTPSERLQMRGRPVTVDTLKEEFIKAGDRIKNDAMNAKQRFQSGNDHIAKQARKVASTVGKIFGIGLLSFSLIALLIFSLIVSGVIDIIPTTGDENYTSFHDFMQIVISDQQTFGITWIAILLVGFSLPLMGILVGTRLLTNIQNRFFKVNFIVFPILISCGVALGIIGVLQTVRDFAKNEKISVQEFTSNAPKLILEEMPQYVNGHRVVSSGGIDLLSIENGLIQEEGVLITYRPSKDSLFHVSQNFCAEATSSKTAIQRCNKIKHEMQLLGTKLVVSPKYSFPASDGFRGQEVELIIEIPKNKTLVINGVNISNPDKEYTGVLYTGEPFEIFD